MSTSSTSPPPTTSVLIPTYRRPELLRRCLEHLGRQTQPADEVLVVWQGDDEATAAAAEAARDAVPGLRLLHLPEPGIVPAENLALEAATGSLVLLIDDDALAPPDWVARHVAHYQDPTVGAVGGPAVNVRPDGSVGPRRADEPVGRLTWLGRVRGNMFDQPDAWRSRPAREVDHLVGYNLSFRRAALDRFEEGLRRYWQGFELDACLQVKAAGFRVLFDFGNVVEHHPTNPVYAGGRDGDLQVKVFNGAYNHAFVLSKHSAWYERPARLAYLFGVGSAAVPGLLGAVVAARRYGQPVRELRVLLGSLRHRAAGWRAGARRRRR